MPVDATPPDASSDATPALRLVPRLEELCVDLVRELGAAGVAINLMSADGSNGVVAASDERSRQLVELQFLTGEGPCLEAFARRRPVLTPDLAGAGSVRWPGYASASLEQGVRAVFAFPLHVGAARLGVLDTFADEPGSLSDVQVSSALRFAGAITELLISGEHTSRSFGLDTGLVEALDYRAEIYQAQGMLTDAFGVTLTEALLRLRSHAFAEGRPLLDVARDVLSGGGMLATPPPDPVV